MACPLPFGRGVQYPQAERAEGVLAVRLDAPMFFANVAWFTERISDYLDEEGKSTSAVRVCIMRCCMLGVIGTVGREGPHGPTVATRRTVACPSVHTRRADSINS